jgi:serine/threonine kinase 16
MMASSLLDLFYSLTNCMACFPSSPNLKINSRSFKILRLLGEVCHTAILFRMIYADQGRSIQGGFSYVYLVQDTSTQQLYALKKIRCPFGQESVSLALKEVEAYSLFSPHPNIIHSVDHSVASDRSDPTAKTVYILLPYYRRGNLQDMINANLVHHTKFPEKRLMILMLGVCRALKAMHQYKVKGAPGGAASQSKAKRVRAEAARADAEAAEEARRAADADDDEVENQPLMDNEIAQAQEGVEAGQLRAYAHRDIKPGKSHSSTQRVPPNTAVSLHIRRQRHDRRRRQNAHPHGSRFPRSRPHTNNLPQPSPRSPRPSRRAQHNAIPGPRTFRRENGQHN